MVGAISSRAIILAAGLTLAACSGGGGGSSSPPPSPPPPPPSNTTPEASVTVSAQAIDEGRPVTIDASGSSDGDGDSLSFSIRQTGGPPATENPPGTEAPDTEGVFVFAAPEVDADEELTFEVTVSDGEASDSATVTVTSENLFREPRFPIGVTQNADIDFTFGGQAFTPGEIRALSFDGEAHFGALTQTQPDPPGSAPVRPAMIFLEPSGSSYAVRQENFFEIFLDGYDVLSIEDIFGSANDDFAFALEATGEVILYGRNPDPGRNTIDNYTNQTAEAPCDLTFESVISDSNGKEMIVGRRDGGVSIYRNNITSDPVVFLGRGTYDLHQAVALTGETCGVVTSPAPVGAGRQNADIIALDTSSGTVRLLVEDEPEKWSASEEVSGFQLSAGQSFGRMVKYRERTSTGLQAVVPFSSDSYTGGHGLVVISREQSGALFAEAFEWAKGAPTSVAIGDADLDGDDDLIVVSRQAAEGIVLERTGTTMVGTPDYAGPAFFETGLGVEGIAATREPGLAGHLLISLPAESVIRPLSAR